MTTKKSKPKREAYQRKLAMKGQKSMRGQADNPYGEVKKNVSFSLTPTAYENLKAFARGVELPASEILERLFRMKNVLDAVRSNMTDSGEGDVISS